MNAPEVFAPGRLGAVLAAGPPGARGCLAGRLLDDGPEGGATGGGPGRPDGGAARNRLAGGDAKCCRWAARSLIDCQSFVGTPPPATRIKYARTQAGGAWRARPPPDLQCGRRAVSRHMARERANRQPRQQIATGQNWTKFVAIDLIITINAKWRERLKLQRAASLGAPPFRLTARLTDLPDGKMPPRR